MKSTGMALAIAGTLLFSGAAHAQDFAEQGTFAFGVERVFGFSLTKRNLDNGPVENNTDTTTFGFAMTSFPPATVYQLPRVGFDYFVIDGLSVGGSLGFATWDAEDEVVLPNGNVARDDRDSNVFLISPRVGYAVMFGDVVGIWPRGGFTFYTQNDDFFNNDVGENGFALTLECHLVIVPLEHVGITLGPVIDIGITGEREDDNPNNPDWDVNQHSFTIVAAGMFGWL